MNVFHNTGIGGLGSNFNRRRTRDQSSTSRDSGSSSTIVAITDKQTKSLLRERDAKISSLEKEVLGLKNKISTLSKEQAMLMGQRKGKKGLTPYGNTVRVSTSKCSAKRRQVGGEGRPACRCNYFHAADASSLVWCLVFSPLLYRTLLNDGVFTTSASISLNISTPPTRTAPG